MNEMETETDGRLGLTADRAGSPSGLGRSASSRDACSSLTQELAYYRDLSEKENERIIELLQECQGLEIDVDLLRSRLSEMEKTLEEGSGMDWGTAIAAARKAIYGADGRGMIGGNRRFLDDRVARAIMQEGTGVPGFAGRAGGADAPEPSGLGPDGRSSLTQPRMLCEDARDFAIEAWGKHWVDNEIDGLCRLAEIETGCHAKAYAEIERLAKIASDNFAEAADLLEAMDGILVAFDSVDDGIEQIARRMRDIARKAIKNAALRVRDGNPGGAETEGLCREAMTARPRRGDAPLPPPLQEEG